MIKFVPVDENPITIQHVYIQSIHVGTLTFSPEKNTFIYESVGGKKTELLHTDLDTSKLALELEFKK